MTNDEWQIQTASRFVIRHLKFFYAHHRFHR